MKFTAALFTALVGICVASPAATTTKKTTTSKSSTTSKPTTTSKVTTTVLSTTTTTTTVIQPPTTTSVITVPTAGPDIPLWNITSLGVNGSGCPPGSAYFLLSPDRTAVTITFSQFEASGGPGIPITNNRKNCQATLGIHVPHGFSFAIVNVDYRGFYQLDSGIKGIRDTSYYFQGQLASSPAASTLLGPISGGNYVYRDTFNLTPVIQSPCGEDTVLNINSAVRIDTSGNSAGSGFITDDSIDASIKQTLNVQWLTC